MRFERLACAALLALLVTGCGPSVRVPPPVSAPSFPEYVAPSVPTGLAGTRAASEHDRAWRWLQAGDLTRAEGGFSAALKANQAFYPATAGLGYVDLSRRRGQQALARFEEVLAGQPGYAPALAGRAEALVALDRLADGLASFQAALAVDPSLADLRRRTEVVRFKWLEQAIGQARQAARAGRADEAVVTYRSAVAASPDSAMLYRELGQLEAGRGDAVAALTHLRKAAELEPSDAKTLLAIGELLEAQRDYDGALQAYSDALAAEPDAATEARVQAARANAERAHMPAEYRAIADAHEVNRGQLAALLAVRLPALVQAGARREAVVLTDVRGHWAASWIQAVARAGIMESFGNHTFQPGGPVRRLDLAVVASRLLSRIGEKRPADARAWQSARLTFGDVAAGNQQYPAASMAVAAGVMTVRPDKTFQPSALVTGAEALQALARLEALAAPPAGARRP